MPEHQYLINKYHWKSKKNVINLSANSTFLFSSIGLKTFYDMLIGSYISLTPSKGLLKLL